jgi:glycosyltransferase involved in cell wall biosynthesis
VSSPLWEEPFGLSTVEAIAAGTPVAALPYGAMKDIVKDSVGCVSQSCDPSDLARAMRAASTKKRSDCFAYSERFSLEQMVDAYESLMLEQLAPNLEESMAWPTA